MSGILAAEFFLTAKPSHKKALATAALYSIPVLFYLFIRFGPMRGPAESASFYGGGLWPKQGRIYFVPMKKMAEMIVPVRKEARETSNTALSFLSMHDPSLAGSHLSFKHEPDPSPDDDTVPGPPVGDTDVDIGCPGCAPASPATA